MFRKYNNRKITIDGETFDSKKEAKRWQELKLLQRSGQITALSRQVKFLLIPAQKANGEVVERACSYIADFTYREHGDFVVEDTKGIKTEVYKIKRKLMLEKYGIRIRET